MGVRPVKNSLGHHLSKVEWKQEQTWLDEGKEEKARHRASKATPIRVGVENQTSRDGNKAEVNKAG